MVQRMKNQRFHCLKMFSKKKKEKNLPTLIFLLVLAKDKFLIWSHVPIKKMNFFRSSVCMTSDISASGNNNFPQVQAPMMLGLMDRWRPPFLILNVEPSYDLKETLQRKRGWERENQVTYLQCGIHFVSLGRLYVLRTQNFWVSFLL